MYPWWTDLLGWVMAGSSMVMIPFVAVYKIVRLPGPASFSKRLKILTTPWRDQQVSVGNGVRAETNQIILNSDTPAPDSRWLSGPRPGAPETKAPCLTYPNSPPLPRPGAVKPRSTEVSKGNLRRAKDAQAELGNITSCCHKPSQVGVGASLAGPEISWAAEPFPRYELSAQTRCVISWREKIRAVVNVCLFLVIFAGNFVFLVSLLSSSSFQIFLLMFFFSLLHPPLPTFSLFLFFCFFLFHFISSLSKLFVFFLFLPFYLICFFFPFFPPFHMPLQLRGNKRSRKALFPVSETVV
ncbi:high-affinity dopamine transporter [Penaeus vannamei]|uniref:High-affinity dopamine transporter n=1 Tax=Penaeus vannamei TaxID=6689 RepID=A0A3R7MI98_PENVA|nr:high-affinity dopamine transporter [Penaeus vannamei]